MTTKHTHAVVFGRKVDGCPRCLELLNGAPAVQWSINRRQQQDQEYIRAIRSHDCKKSGCGPVCTAFQW